MTNEEATLVDFFRFFQSEVIKRNLLGYPERRRPINMINIVHNIVHSVRR